MGLFEDIFPSKGSEELVQTQWSEGWFSGASGFGYAAEHLTQHRQSFGALVDQVGLAVFFLQRHRVEMILKGLLDAAGAPVMSSHGLLNIWAQCQTAVEPKDAKTWKEFAAEQYELVKVLDGVDPSSYAFRYPVDTKGAKVTRPAFIDLAALDKYVERLSFGATGYLDYLSENGLL